MFKLEIICNLNNMFKLESRSKNCYLLLVLQMPKKLRLTCTRLLPYTRTKVKINTKNKQINFNVESAWISHINLMKYRVHIYIYTVILKEIGKLCKHIPLST